MAAIVVDDGAETEREMELRLYKLIIPEESVQGMIKLANEKRIRKRIKYMTKYWYRYPDQGEAPFHVRIQFVKNMISFVEFVRSCVYRVRCRKQKMIKGLKMVVVPFNLVMFWCNEMIGDKLEDHGTIFTYEHARLLRKELGLTRHDVKVGHEWAQPRWLDPPSSSEPSSSSDPEDELESVADDKDGKEDKDVNMDEDDVKTSQTESS